MKTNVTSYAETGSRVQTPLPHRVLLLALLLFTSIVVASDCSGTNVNSNLTLTENMTSAGTCYSATTSDITINCNGFSITGDGSGYGIYSDQNRTEIKNCDTQNFDIGMYINGDPNETGAITNGGKIVNSTSSSTSYINYGTGIIIVFSSNNNITNSSSIGNLTGIQLYSSNHNVISNSSSVGYNYVGLLVEYSANNTIANNSISGHDWGIRAGSLSPNNNYTNNTVIGGTFAGVALDNDDSSSRIIGNKVNPAPGGYCFQTFGMTDLYLENNCSSDLWWKDDSATVTYECYQEFSNQFGVLASDGITSCGFNNGTYALSGDWTNGGGATYDGNSDTWDNTTTSATLYVNYTKPAAVLSDTGYWEFTWMVADYEGTYGGSVDWGTLVSSGCTDNLNVQLKIDLIAGDGFYASCWNNIGVEWMQVYYYRGVVVFNEEYMQWSLYRTEFGNTLNDSIIGNIWNKADGTPASSFCPISSSTGGSWNDNPSIVFNNETACISPMWSGPSMDAHPHVSPIPPCVDGIISSLDAHLICENGNYTLNEDLSIGGSTGIFIEANNTHLNCNNHSITGDGTSGTYGIYFNYNTATVTNCTIYNFGTSVGFNSTARYNTVYNNIFRGSSWVYNPDLVNQSCYQKTATENTTCGGLNNGSYTYEGDWIDPTNMYDGDWSTYAAVNTSSSDGYFFVNYTTPENISWANISFDLIGDNSGLISVNVPLIPFCLNSNVQIKYDIYPYVSYGGWHRQGISISCMLSNSTWTTIYSEGAPRGYFDSTLFFVEDAIGWHSGCFQEFANESTSCGGVSSGSYNWLPDYTQNDYLSSFGSSAYDTNANDWGIVVDVNESSGVILDISQSNFDTNQVTNFVVLDESTRNLIYNITSPENVTLPEGRLIIYSSTDGSATSRFYDSVNITEPLLTNSQLLNVSAVSGYENGVIDPYDNWMWRGFDVLTLRAAAVDNKGYDSNWETCTYSSGRYYVNYTIPDNIVGGEWLYSSGGYPLNYYIPISCFYSGTLRLQAYTSHGSESSQTLYCFNSNGWTSIGNIGNFGIHGAHVCEEAMNWFADTTHNNFNLSGVGNRYQFASGVDSYLVYAIWSTDGDFWADNGTTYPYDARNVAEWFGAGIDHNPYTLLTSYHNFTSINTTIITGGGGSSVVSITDIAGNIGNFIQYIIEHPGALFGSEVTAKLAALLKAILDFLLCGLRALLLGIELFWWIIAVCIAIVWRDFTKNKPAFQPKRITGRAAIAAVVAIILFVLYGILGYSPASCKVSITAAVTSSVPTINAGFVHTPLLGIELYIWFVIVLILYAVSQVLNNKIDTPAIACFIAAAAILILASMHII